MKAPSFCMWTLLLSSCVIVETPPPYAPPEGPPCEALPGTSEPVYLCEDVTQGLLFVREDGYDRAQGSREEPVKTLQRAFELAREQSDKKAILVAGSPTLTGPYTWPRAIDVLGGFDTDFQQDETVRPTFSSQNAPVLSLNGLMQPVRLAHVDVQLTSNTSFPPRPVLLVESSTLVQLHSVSITAPDGVAGVDGLPGVPGQDGEKGLAGGQGTRIAPGMPGMNTSCPDAQGGAGGRGGDSAMQETSGEASVLGASGGAIEEPGASGMPGMSGQAGRDATLWTWSMEAMEATVGEAGLPGQGGGGGGGGDDLGGQGGGGGGGGAGGCGGTGGTPGTSGGWSLGVVLVQSALELLGKTRIETGDAGRAGRGGEGGQGGAGAMGGTGAIGSGGGEAGGRGGDGASGGQGGRGGHGQPGQSIGILCVESSVTQGEEVVLLPGRHGASLDGMMVQGEPLSGCP